MRARKREQMNRAVKEKCIYTSVGQTDQAAYISFFVLFYGERGERRNFEAAAFGQISGHAFLFICQGLFVPVNRLLVWSSRLRYAVMMLQFRESRGWYMQNAPFRPKCVVLWDETGRLAKASGGKNRCDEAGK
jgi:hypothetical protein